MASVLTSCKVRKIDKRGKRKCHSAQLREVNAISISYQQMSNVRFGKKRKQAKNEEEDLQLSSMECGKVNLHPVAAKADFRQ